MAASEKVLVVPRNVLFGAPRRAFDGFRPDAAEAFLAAASGHGAYRARERVEDDPALKQLIPYALVTCRSEVFLMRRKGGGERRLRERYSLGVGGHVNDGDAPATDPAAAVRAALERELHEELVVETPISATLLGVLNDDSNAVGRVHFGVVYRLEAEEPRVRVRETDELDGRFVPVRELAAYLERMETWSRLVAEALFGCAEECEKS